MPVTHECNRTRINILAKRILVIDSVEMCWLEGSVHFSTHGHRDTVQSHTCAETSRS